MPSYRLLHTNCRTGRKTKALSDVEYLTWLAYLLSADDFGVCPASPVKLQGDDPRLRGKATRLVAKSIQALLDSDLVRQFEDGTEAYLYQPDWQEWQRIKYPSDTSYPPVPATLLARCQEKTVAHFVERHPQRLTVYRDPIALLTTANANASAHASDPDGGVGETGGPHPIKALLTEHERLFTARYGQTPAKYGARDAKHAKELIEAYGFDRAKAILGAFFESRDSFIAQCGHGLGPLVNGTVQNKLIAEMSGRKPMGDKFDGLREFVARG